MDFFCKKSIDTTTTIPTFFNKKFEGTGMRNLLPQFISEKFEKEKFNGSFDATIMFVDISGFTA
ncbi:MAG: hypothetical protein DRZ79_05215, partial [Candidatus Cloacimonadota bacterium]